MEEWNELPRELPDGDFIRSLDTCTVCGKHILTQTFKNEGVCSGLCRRKKLNEPNVPGWHEIEMIQVPTCARCGKTLELNENNNWQHS